MPPLDTLYACRHAASDFFHRRAADFRRHGNSRHREETEWRNGI